MIFLPMRPNESLDGCGGAEMELAEMKSRVRRLAFSFKRSREILFRF
jgi:hypothetical protein